MIRNSKIITLIKLFISLVIICATMLLLASYTIAHSGRTDSSGGHRDNKNASGLGSYHYHHGYGPHLHPGGECPYAPKKSTPTPTKISVASIKIDSSDISLDVGEQTTLSVTVSPADATNKSIVWSSSDNDIATISTTGIVTAKNSGTAIITAKSNNGKSHNISLIVKMQIDAISIIEKDIIMDVGENKKISAKITPEGENIPITWSSSDRNIATISNEGIITAISPGSTIITALVSNGKSDSANISIKDTEETSDQKVLAAAMETNPANAPDTNQNNSGSIVAGVAVIGIIAALAVNRKRKR